MLDKRIGFIICETAAPEPIKPTIITERNNRIVIEAILQDMDVLNRNRRFYPHEEMIPELTSARMKELISSGNMKGEAGHPQSKDIVRQQTIDPMKAQVKYLKVWHDGSGNILGHVVGCQNQLGEDFNNDIKDGELPSFSLRALGTIQNTRRGAEVRNVKIITWDRVYYPSHSKAYMQNVVSESAVTNLNENKICIQKDDPGLVIPITNQSVIDYIKTESCNLKMIQESFDTLYDSISLLENGRQVQLSSNEGDIIIVNLENYIQNEIMNYCYKR